jgi:HTH-type transcriptional regulator, competence development regulator
MIIGKKLRELRESKGLLLRQVAAELEVDTAYISKMERGEKNIKKEYVIRLAKLYAFDENELISLWLADRVFDIIRDDSSGARALEIAKDYYHKTI